MASPLCALVALFSQQIPLFLSSAMSLGVPLAPITLGDGTSIFLPLGRFPYRPRHFDWKPVCQLGTQAPASAARGRDPSLFPSPQVTASLLARSEPIWLGTLSLHATVSPVLSRLMTAQSSSPFRQTHPHSCPLSQISTESSQGRIWPIDGTGLPPSVSLGSASAPGPART